MTTAHLRLVPHEPSDLRALIRGPGWYAQSFGVPAAVGLREFLVSKDVSAEFLAWLARSDKADAWTHGFALVHPEDGFVVGTASFKGAPDAQGAVEIAYGVVPGYQGRGLATEAAGALVDFAWRSGQVRLVLAHTLPVANASGRVLTKCGFRKVGEVTDPEDGVVWRWEHSTPNTAH